MPPRERLGSGCRFRGWSGCINQPRRLKCTRLIHPTSSLGRRAEYPSEPPIRVASKCLGLADREVGQVRRRVRAGARRPDAIRIWPVRPYRGILVRRAPEPVPEEHNQEHDDASNEDEQTDHRSHGLRLRLRRQQTRSHGLTWHEPTRGMPERFYGAVLKTARAAKPSGVRIPLPPLIRKGFPRIHITRSWSRVAGNVAKG